PFDDLLDIGTDAAIVLKPLRAIFHANAGAFAAEFVERALVRILKPSPAADVVDEHDREIGVAARNVVEEPLKPTPSFYAQAALTLVGISAHNLHSVGCRIVGDSQRLVFRGVLLVFRGHANILRCSYHGLLWPIIS